MGNSTVGLAEIYGAGPIGGPVDADDVFRLSAWTELITGGIIGVEYQADPGDGGYWKGTGMHERFTKGERRGGRHERAFVYYAHAGQDYAERAGTVVPAWIGERLTRASERLESLDAVELADAGATRGEGVFNARYCYTHGGMVGNSEPRETCGRCHPNPDVILTPEEEGPA